MGETAQANTHKEMRYLAEMAEAAGIANPMGSAVKNYDTLAEAAGRSADFVPTLADFVAVPSGIETTGAERPAAQWRPRPVMRRLVASRGAG